MQPRSLRPHQKVREPTPRVTACGLIVNPGCQVLTVPGPVQQAGLQSDAGLAFLRSLVASALAAQTMWSLTNAIRPSNELDQFRDTWTRLVCFSGIFLYLSYMGER